MKAKYSFKPGSRLKGNISRVNQELERVRTKTGGLTAKAVVAAARPESAYIHRYFTWDNRAAAEKCREMEARHLINCVVVTFQDGDKETAPARAYVSIGNKDDKYLSITNVLSQADLRSEMLAQALKELVAFREKYATLKELDKVFAAIEKTLAVA